jgi:hypothetical protein
MKPDQVGPASIGVCRAEGANRAFFLKLPVYYAS